MARSKSTAAVVVGETTTTTTTTTTVTVVDETVAAAVAEETTITITQEDEKKEEEGQESKKRELPIFNNPLLADEKASAATLKPKSGRVKVQGGKTATIAVLKLSAPKVDGEVVVMRRMDSNLVNATLMFQAAFPAATEQWITRENTHLTKTYESHGAVVEDSESGTLAGVWVTISQAKELAKEYSIEQFMLPLLNAPARKNTIKAAATASPAAASSASTTEIIAKEEITVEETTSVAVAAAIVVEKVTVTSEETVVVEEETEVINEENIVEVLEIKEVEKIEEKVEDKEEEKNEQEQEQTEESTGSKRRREEDEEQAAKDRKRFRGFVTVAVGLAAVAATIPQVLPYFSS